jgi:hypothetical protein
METAHAKKSAHSRNAYTFHGYSAVCKEKITLAQHKAEKMHETRSAA